METKTKSVAQVKYTPELLAVCKDVILIIERFGENSQDCMMRLTEWLPDACALIAKIEGR